MDPIEHPSRPIAPVPVHPDRQIVVLASLQEIHVQVRPAGFELHGARLKFTPLESEVLPRCISPKLGPMLTKAIKDPTLARDKPTRMHISPTQRGILPIEHLHRPKKRLRLNRKAAHHDRPLKIARCRAIGPEHSRIDQPRSLGYLRPCPNPHPIIAVVRKQNPQPRMHQTPGFGLVVIVR